MKRGHSDHVAALMHLGRALRHGPWERQRDRESSQPHLFEFSNGPRNPAWAIDAEIEARGGRQQRQHELEEQLGTVDARPLRRGMRL